MISPDEFLRRCERVKVEFAVEGRDRQQLTCELAALCALTGARAESLYDCNSQLTGLRVSDPGGDLVIAGQVDKVLAELVAGPVSYQDRGSGRSVHRRPRDSRNAAPPVNQLAQVIRSWHSALELEVRAPEALLGKGQTGYPVPRSGRD